MFDTLENQDKLDLALKVNENLIDNCLYNEEEGMHRQFYGSEILGIGIARKGLRRVKNSELVKSLLKTDDKFVSWFLGGSSQGWWRSLPTVERANLESDFQKKNGQPLDFSSPADRVLLWKTVIRERQIVTSHKWIVEHTGIRERQFAEEGVATSDLACDAAVEALEVAKIDATEIDGIFLGTVSDDHPQTPPTTAIIAQKLGIAKGGMRNIVFRDISEACTSSLAALDTAYAHIQTGRCKTALVIGADEMGTTMSPFSRNLWPILAAGAGALVLRRTHLDKDSFGPNAFFSYLDGSLAPLIVTPAGGSRMPVTAEMITNPFAQTHLMYMQGPRVRKEAIRILLPMDFDKNHGNTAIPVALREAGFPMETKEDFKKALNHFAMILFHQANKVICDDLATRLKKQFGYRGVCPSNISRYGNTTSASWIILLYEMWRKGKLKFVRDGRNPKRVLVVVFGGGFTVIIGSFLWTLGLPD